MPDTIRSASNPLPMEPFPPSVMSDRPHKNRGYCNFPKCEWMNSPWLACITGSIILWVSFGVRQTLGIFLLPLSNDLNYSRSQFSIAAALLQLLWGVCQPFIVYIGERKIGFGKTIFVSCLIYSVSSFTMYGSLASNPSVFIFAAALQGISAGGNSFPIVLATLSQRIPGGKYKSIAFGMVSSFGSFGQCCFLPMGRAMISAIGWRWTFLVFGIMMAVCSPLAMFLQTIPPPSSRSTTLSLPANDKIADEKNMTPCDDENTIHPKTEAVFKTDEKDINTVNQDDLGFGEVLKQAFTSPTYILITLGFSVCGFHVSFLSTHLPAYLVDHHIDPSLAAWVISVIGLGSMFGTMAVGFICTRIKPKYVLSAIYLGRAIILSVFFWVPISLTTVFVFSVIFGFLWLSTVPATTKFVGDLFGQKYLGTLTSITFIGHQIGAFCGAYIGGLVYDSMQNYTRLFYSSIALAIFAAVANLLARDNPAKAKQVI